MTSKEYIKRELQKLKKSKYALKVKIIDNENNQTNYINLNKELIKQLKTKMKNDKDLTMAEWFEREENELRRSTKFRLQLLFIPVVAVFGWVVLLALMIKNN